MLKAVRPSLLRLLLLLAAPALAQDTHQPQLPSMVHVGHPPQGQDIQLTLADAVYLSLRQNRSIRSAAWQRLAQKFDLRVAEDQFTPKLTIASNLTSGRNQTGTYRYGELAPSVSLSSEWGTRFSLAWTRRVDYKGSDWSQHNDGVSFSVIQPLLKGGGYEAASADVRLARLNEQAYRLSLKATVSQTVTQVIQAYRELVRAQEQLRISQQALGRARQLLDVNQALIAAGRMARFDILQTEADIANQELGVEDAGNQLETARRELLRLLAMDLNVHLEAADSLIVSPVDIKPEAAVGIALHNQPDYLTQLIQREQSDISLNLARNQKLWDVSLVAGVGDNQSRTSSSDGTSQGRTWDKYLGLQIAIPVGDLRPRQTELRAEVDVRDKALRLEEAKQNLERSIGDAVRELRSRWRQYQIAQRARELAQQKLEFEREKLKAGRSSNFQVLSYEADLRTAENALLSAKLNYLNAQTSLDEKLGMTLTSWSISLND